MTDEQKAPWIKNGADDRARYDVEIAAEIKANGGKKLLTASEKKIQAAQLGLKGDANGNDKKSKRAKDPNTPKKPLSPFFIFLKKRRMEMAGDEQLTKNVTNFTKNAGVEWNALTAEQKLMYKHDGELGKAILLKAAKEASKEASTPASLNVTNTPKPNPPQKQPTVQRVTAPKPPQMNGNHVQQQRQMPPASPHGPPQGIIAHMNGHA